MTKIRRDILVLVLALVALAALSYLPSARVERAANGEQIALPRDTEWYKVIRVVDGDTIVAEIDGQDVRVRLLGIDTPETVDPNGPEECFGQEATAAAQMLFGQGYVRLELEPLSSTLYDEYGRLLAYAFVPASSKQEGILANEYLVAEGFAREFEGTMRYTYEDRIESAERAAREMNRGLWSACEA